MSTTVITLSVVAILVLFAVWALAPTVRANRQRILRSPATWAVVVLLCAVLVQQYELAQIRRQMERDAVRFKDCQWLLDYKHKYIMQREQEHVDQVIQESNEQLEQIDARRASRGN